MRKIKNMVIALVLGMTFVSCGETEPVKKVVSQERYQFVNEEIQETYRLQKELITSKADESLIQAQSDKRDSLNIVMEHVINPNAYIN